MSHSGLTGRTATQQRYIKRRRIKGLCDKCSRKAIKGRFYCEFHKKYKINYNLKQKKLKDKKLMKEKINELIDAKIDHYEPYRPILDSKEAEEVRKVLYELKKEIKKL